MSLIDVDAAPARGPDDPIGHAPPEEGRRRTPRAGDGQQRGGRVVRGHRQRVCRSAGGATFRHRRHPDLPWSIGGGDLCHVVLGNGGTLWRMADASRPIRTAGRGSGRSAGRGGPRGRPEPWLSGFRRHRLGVDAPGEIHLPALSQPLRLQPRAEPGERALFHDRARARRSPAAGGPERPSARAATALLPAGEALVSWVTPRDDGPAGTLGLLRTLDGRAAA